MSIETLTAFFKWCTILNAAILIYSSLFLCFAPGFVYRLQSKWYSISRESFDIIAYSYLGVFKVLFIVFSLVPWLALVIIS